MNYDELIDKLMQHFTSEKYRDEVVEAKRKFFARAGVFDEESIDFEIKTAQFMDWYLFSRPLKEAGITPIQSALKNSEYKISEDLRPYYENLAANRHSLFEFIRIKGVDIHIYDLLAEEKIVVERSNVTIGFNSDEIFETRLIPHSKNYVFTRSFCFHPADARKYILAECKKARKLEREDQEELIQRLFQMRYKYEQYKHVNLDLIYSNAAAIKI